MGKTPNELRKTIARNIRACRLRKFPGRGGGKKCAEQFGVSPQQWSPWERGMRTPDESRLLQIAKFFNVSVEYLRRDALGSEPLHNQMESAPQQTHGTANPSGPTVYVPVVIILPHLPKNVQTMLEQFTAILNTAQAAPHSPTLAKPE